MAVDAADVSGQNRVGVRQIELASLVEMAGKAGLGGLAGIDDGTGLAAGLDVKAARSVAGLASGVPDLCITQLESRVSRPGKVIGLILMALDAFLGSDQCRPRDLGRSHYDPIGGNARNEEYGPEPDTNGDEL